MTSRYNSELFKKWRLDNADKVLKYKRDYHRRNYARLHESRKEEMHNRYVWKSTAAKFRKILMDQ